MSAPVRLQTLTRRHADALLELRLRNKHFLEPWEPRRPAGYLTLTAQREELAAVEAERRHDRGYAFGIVESATDELVGRIALSGVARGPFQNASLGYFVDEGRQGRGYATAAVRLALAFAFGEARLHRVQAAVMPRNLASLRVLEKAGFRQEGLALRYLEINGRWEDHVLHGVTREEWG